VLESTRLPSGSKHAKPSSLSTLRQLEASLRRSSSMIRTPSLRTSRLARRWRCSDCLTPRDVVTTKFWTGMTGAFSGEGHSGNNIGLWSQVSERRTASKWRKTHIDGVNHRYLMKFQVENVDTVLCCSGGQQFRQLDTSPLRKWGRDTSASGVDEDVWGRTKVGSLGAPDNLGLQSAGRCLYYDGCFCAIAQDRSRRSCQGGKADAGESDDVRRTR